MMESLPKLFCALAAWKPAKDTGFHIPTATATAAVKPNKSLNPRKSHDFPDSCAEPFLGQSKFSGGNTRLFFRLKAEDIIELLVLKYFVIRLPKVAALF
jgi:hypothetical protein